jgi:hypothetical protein
VDCLNRHGVKTLASCCGHGFSGDIILAAEAITFDRGNWILHLCPKPVVLPYNDETGDWDEEYPSGGRNLSRICHEMNLDKDQVTSDNKPTDKIDP